MTTEKALATVDHPSTDGQLAPYEKATDVIARATEWANALMDVVEKKKLYAMINGKKHLEAEAWELIMAFDQAGPQTEWVRPMEDLAGMVLGYTAQVSIVKRGLVKATAIMPCGFDDFPCRGKEGTARVKAAMSAAQTWAMAKACRLCYSPVAVLAGYAATPAEEMKHGSAPPIAQSQPRPKPTRERLGTCEEHNRPWGRMPDGGAGHPMGKDQPWHIQSAVPETPPEYGNPDTPLGELQREVDQEMEWASFEKDVLKMPWPEWVRLTDAPIETARTRWEAWKQKQEAQP